MIATLRGTIISKELESVVVESAGVGREIRVTAATASRLGGLGSEALLYISESFAMYGGATTLYGFLDGDEKALYVLFRDEIPGTGAKKALEYLEKASKSLPDFRRAVIDRDEKLLCGVFGFSKKTAEKLLTSLKDKLDEMHVSGSPRLARKSAQDLPPGSWGQALAALEALGYRFADAKSALQSMSEASEFHEMSAEQLVRQALKRL